MIADWIGWARAKKSRELAAMSSSPYRGCLVDVSRLLTEKDLSELTLRYQLNAELFTQPAAVIRALEERNILSEEQPESMLDVLKGLKNEKALTLWKHFMDGQQNGVEIDNVAERDSSDSDSGHEWLENSTSACCPDLPGLMEEALRIAQNSRDWNTKVGAVIVHPQKGIVSTGYNHMPKDSEEYSWSREGKWIDTKYPYVVGAAVDAVLKCEHRSDMKGAILITTLHPGNISAMVLAEVGIQAVWYYENKYPDRDHIIAGAIILRYSNILCKMVPHHASKMVS